MKNPFEKLTNVAKKVVKVGKTGLQVGTFLAATALPFKDANAQKTHKPITINNEDEYKKKQDAYNDSLSLYNYGIKALNKYPGQNFGIENDIEPYVDYFPKLYKDKVIKPIFLVKRTIPNEPTFGQYEDDINKNAPKDYIVKLSEGSAKGFVRDNGMISPGGAGYDFPIYKKPVQPYTLNTVNKNTNIPNYDRLVKPPITIYDKDEYLKKEAAWKDSLNAYNSAKAYRLKNYLLKPDNVDIISNNEKNKILQSSPDRSPLTGAEPINYTRFTFKKNQTGEGYKTLYDYAANITNPIQPYKLGTKPKKDTVIKTKPVIEKKVEQKPYVYTEPTLYEKPRSINKYTGYVKRNLAEDARGKYWNVEYVSPDTKGAVVISKDFVWTVDNLQKLFGVKKE